MIVGVVVDVSECVANQLTSVCTTIRIRHGDYATDMKLYWKKRHLLNIPSTIYMEVLVSWKIKPLHHSVLTIEFIWNKIVIQICFYIHLYLNVKRSFQSCLEDLVVDNTKIKLHCIIYYGKKSKLPHLNHKHFQIGKFFTFMQLRYLWTLYFGRLTVIKC